VSVLGVNNTARIDSKLPPSAADAMAALPEVGALAHTRYALLHHPDTGVVGVWTTGTADVPNLHVYRGRDRAEALAAGEVMIGPALARRRDLDPGDRFTVPGLHGPVELTVGGIWAGAESLGSSIFLDGPGFEAIAGDRPPTYQLASPAPGVGLDELSEAIERAGLDDHLRAFTPEELGDQLAADIGDFVDPFTALQRALLLVAFIATLSTLLLAAVQRRRELATLAAVGMAPGDLARMTLAEAAVVGLVATALGVVAGSATYVSFVFLSPTVTGLPMAWVSPLGAVPVVLPLVVAVAVAGAAWPAWRSTRVEPALALRYE
jgi:putative ABC transport system permease protein